MKKRNGLANGLLVASMALVLATGGSAYASGDYHELSITPPNLESSNGGITIFGANPPSSGASSHDVSVSDYNYQISKIGYRVYTDKWLTGTTSLKVTVDNWKLVEDYGGTSNSLTIAVHKSSGGIVASKTINTNEVLRASFTDLTKSSNYYVSFSVPNNGNTYSFNGSISK